MKKLFIGALALGAVTVGAFPALAHVTVQPNEAQTGSFSRFVVRVPNERDDASTIKVKVELPPLAFVSFEPKDGWNRQVEEGEFDQPIEAFGSELTEGVLSVTWSGGEVKAGEFTEFGFSARMPDEETTLEFLAYQTYDSGEIVEWTGPADGDEPAARVTTFDLGGAETGQLGVIDQLADESLGGADNSDGEEPSDDAEEGTAAPEDDGDEDDDSEGLALILGGVGASLGAIALIVALSGRRKQA